MFEKWRGKRRIETHTEGFAVPYVIEISPRTPGWHVHRLEDALRVNMNALAHAGNVADVHLDYIPVAMADTIEEATTLADKLAERYPDSAAAKID